ncbi:GtrA family protein [Hydromonas duriensis]|uniref:Putative flippase GtrA n=1 Tax=Hydromonas duriensis TaxID=1527608 RepID=A0A4R6Y4C4_9BURK|nr:GtrA family protein [Hydromonas duriensis]TDR28820.1 putative flippase GtrA [Hydromonas duriensis]
MKAKDWFTYQYLALNSKMSKILNSTILRFAIVGLIGFLVDVCVFYLLKEVTGIYKARVTSFVAAASTTFILNKSFTFQKHNTKKRPADIIRQEYLRYLLLMTMGGMVNYAVFTATLHILGTHSFLPALAIAFGSGVAMALNYTSSRYYVFNHKNSSSNL